MTTLSNETPAHPRPRWASQLAGWAEWVIPRGVGLLFLYAGAKKFWDPTKTHRVLAFDGVPGSLVVPMTHVVWLGEVVLGLLLVIGIAKRRAIVATILVLLVYSLQLAYLFMADNPPKDCACVALFAKYASAKQQLVIGLVRNAVLAMAMEWVRLRMDGRARTQPFGFPVQAASTSTTTAEKTEDG
jgi:hypothetical protein